MKQQPTFSPNEISRDIDVIFQQLRMIHSLYLVSIIVYVIGGIFLKQFVMESDSGFVGLPSTTYLPLIITLIIVSTIIGIVGLVVLPQRNSPEKLIEREKINSSTELARALVSAHYARVAFFSSIAIFGLVLFLLNGNSLILFVFNAAAFVLLLLIFPRQKEWDEARALFEKNGYGSS